MELTGRAGQHCRRARAVSPAAGKAEQSPSKDIARKVLLRNGHLAARPALAEDLLADRKAVRLLDPAPIIDGGRTPEIGERDCKKAACRFDRRISTVFDRELRLQARSDAREPRATGREPATAATRRH